MPRRLRFVGWAEFASRMPYDVRLLKHCLSELAAQYPESAAEVEYAN
jgi:hypothetical protein